MIKPRSWCSIKLWCYTCYWVGLWLPLGWAWAPKAAVAQVHNQATEAWAQSNWAACSQLHSTSDSSALWQWTVAADTLRYAFVGHPADTLHLVPHIAGEQGRAWRCDTVWCVSVQRIRLSYNASGLHIQGVFDAQLRFAAGPHGALLAAELTPQLSFRLAWLPGQWHWHDTLYYAQQRWHANGALVQAATDSVWVQMQYLPNEHQGQITWLGRRHGVACGLRTDRNQWHLQGPIHSAGQWQWGPDGHQLRAQLRTLPGSSLRHVVQTDLAVDVKTDPLVRFVKASTPLRTPAAEPYMVAQMSLELGAGTELTLMLPSSYDDYVQLPATGRLQINKRPGQTWQVDGELLADEGTLVDGRFLKNLPLGTSNRIAFDGQHADPALHLQASVSVAASPERLFAQELARSTEAEKMLFRRPLPFDVQVSVGGLASAPRFDFRVDLPPRAQASLNGLVQGKLLAINQSAYWAPLQATALIALRRFEGSNLSEAKLTTATLAAQQLGKLMGGLARSLMPSVNFRIDYFSYDDYGQVAAEPTRREFEFNLAKAFLHQRFVMEVGGVVTLENSAQELVRSLGDRYQPGLLLSYYFGKQANAYVQAYSFTSYTGILDGRVRETGARIGLNVAFDRLAELWYQSVPSPAPVLPAPIQP